MQIYAKIGSILPAKVDVPGCENAAGQFSQEWQATAGLKFTKPGASTLADLCSSDNPLEILRMILILHSGRGRGHSQKGADVHQVREQPRLLRRIPQVLLPRDVQRRQILRRPKRSRDRRLFHLRHVQRDGRPPPKAHRQRRAAQE